MSTRLVEPARSPLRRTKQAGEGSVFGRKLGKESGRPPSAKKVQGIATDPEADALRAQANEVDLELEHLSPVFQRFWQRSKNPENFSPRSRRLSAVIPKPKSKTAFTLAKLTQVRGQVATELTRARQVQEITSSFLQRYFEMIPACKLTETIQSFFKSFDKDHDGFLDEGELKSSFQAMGKKLSDEEMKLIIQEYDVDFNGCFDVVEFESMIRASLHIGDSQPEASKFLRFRRASVAT